MIARCTRLGLPIQARLSRFVASVSFCSGVVCSGQDKHGESVRPGDEPSDFRLPDFTVSYEGDTYYWEHLGMLSVPSYREQWDRKRQWYEANGFWDRVITSEDGPDGGIDASEIERTARKRILLEN